MEYTMASKPTLIEPHRGDNTGRRQECDGVLVQPVDRCTKAKTPDKP